MSPDRPRLTVPARRAHPPHFHVVPPSFDTLGTLQHCIHQQLSLPLDDNGVSLWGARNDHATASRTLPQMWRSGGATIIFAAHQTMPLCGDGGAGWEKGVGRADRPFGIMR